LSPCLITTLALSLYGLALLAWTGPASLVDVVAPREDLAPSTVVTAPPSSASAPPARAEALELRRGDTFLGALMRGGIARRVGESIATALSRSGVNLRRVKPDHTLEVRWNRAGEPVGVQDIA